LISTGFPYRPGDKLKPYLNMLGEVMSQCAGVRRPGAAALDLAHIAAGYTDGFFETGLQPWDVAAGSLLITEAGGLIGNYTGEADFIEQGECVAGNPRVYGQLVATLSKYSKFAGAGDKASVRQALQAGDTAASPAAEASAPSEAAPAAKPTLKAKRITKASVMPAPAYAPAAAPLAVAVAAPEAAAEAAPAAPAPQAAEATHSAATAAPEAAPESAPEAASETAPAPAAATDAPF
jgi:myo-inositol-1(or 4)-monophosphatase